jgi:hypothetical protein
MHMQAVEEKRREKCMRSRWNRMLLGMRAAAIRRNRQEAISELANLRAECSHAPNGEDINATLSGQDRTVSGGDEVALAAQLGLDLATYRLLRELEQREIMPEDYDLLGRLDETVKSNTLTMEELERFVIKRYTARISNNTALVGVGVVQSKSPLFKFGLDYWRLPLPIEDEDKDAGEQDCKKCCSCSFGADYWKLPFNTTEDFSEASTEASTTASEIDEKSDGHTMDVCGVCLVDFDHGDELRVLPCGHYFHRECIDHWLLNSSTVCPVDKRDFRQAEP